MGIRCERAKGLAGASLIIVNAQPTPFDDIADVRLSDAIGAVLPELLQ